MLYSSYMAAGCLELLEFGGFQLLSMMIIEGKWYDSNSFELAEVCFMAYQVVYPRVDSMHC